MLLLSRSLVYSTHTDARLSDDGGENEMITLQLSMLIAKSAAGAGCNSPFYILMLFGGDY